jgi:DNA-binding NarL/FixJ family response regulator
MSPLRVLTVDDHPVVRQGLRWMLDKDPEVSVAAEADDLAGTVAALDAGGIDVVLLDIDLGPGDGLAVLRVLAERDPPVPTVMLTMFDDPEYVEQAVRAGARGYLLKDVPQAELVRALRAVAAGGAYIQAEVTYPLLVRFARDVRSSADPPDLSEREVEVIRLAARGLANKQIGAALCRSEATVKDHLRNVYRKLGAADRAQAVAIALRTRLID